MPQVPALFLPKKKPDTQVKNIKKNRKKLPTDSDKKTSALFKGRNDGYQKINSEVYGTTG